VTQDPDAKSSPSAIDQVLSRFDLLIDQLTAPKPTDVEPPADAEADVETVEQDPDVEHGFVVAPAADVEIETDVEIEADLEIEPEADLEPEAQFALAPQRTLVAPAKAVPFASDAPVVLSVSGLVKRFGSTVAVDGVDLQVHAGQIFGIVGPNGAGKTTTLSIVTGVLRPDQGEVLVNGRNVWTDPAAAKREVGILPDRLLLFDRLTGRQLLYYSGMLRGLDRATVISRTADLIRAFDLTDAQDRLVTDYSAGMTRKVALAAAMIHSPRLLILDEPFESVDAVSVATVLGILRNYAQAGGTVVLSSHSMDLVESFCDSVAVVAEGRILTSGTTESVRGDISLEDRFVSLIGDLQPGEDMEWLRSFSD
jgi:ABC-2 type transport system ATP-binding protein